MNILASLALALSASTNGLPRGVPLERVETVYWDCEASARDRFLSEGEAAACSEAFERIKAEKFDGSFERFMRWWEANRKQEHAKRERK